MGLVLSKKTSIQAIILRRGIHNVAYAYFSLKPIRQTTCTLFNYKILLKYFSLFRSLIGVEVSELDKICASVVAKYTEYETKRLSSST